MVPMAKENSFDIVSQVDLQEVNNAVNQAVKELQTRFDFKGTDAKFELDEFVVTQRSTMMVSTLPLLVMMSLNSKT